MVRMLRSPQNQEKCLSESDISSINDDHRELEPGGRAPNSAKRKRPAEGLPYVNNNKIDQILQLITRQNSRLDDLEGHIREIKSQSSAIQSTNSDIVKSVDHVTQQLTLMQLKIDGLETKRQDMCTQVHKLENKIDYLEKSTVKTSVEIRQVPKQAKENKEGLYKVLQNLTSSLGLSLGINEIRDVYRQPSKVADTKSTIVVEFSNTLKKSNFLNSARIRNKSTRLSTKDLGIGGVDDPIYISEHLTSKSRHLYFHGREVAKSCQLAFCWTSNGQVLIREEEGSAPVVVKSEEQLEEIKNKHKNIQTN